MCSLGHLIALIFFKEKAQSTNIFINNTLNTKHQTVNTITN